MDNKTLLNRIINTTAINIKASEIPTNFAGYVISGKYTIESKMDVPSGEADLYICSDGHKHYVAKVYRRKVAIKNDVTRMLQSIESPYVAKIYNTGSIDGYPYEILPYYKNGSLQGKVFSFDELRTRIIPSLNEGLRALHDAGIIHKDLKPSNIMLSDDGKDISIIDFGISSIRENNSTVVITQTGMTPEYSAPETFRNLFLIESDYYSLGITIFELYYGHTPYEQLSREEIEQFVSLQKLPLPSEMQEELKILISSLTYPDITNRKDKSNPNRRWGYEETLKWCVGIKQPVPGYTSDIPSVSDSIRPYNFAGNVYNDIDDLTTSLALHWEDGKKQLFRGLLSAYFKNFNAEIAGACMDAEDEVSSADEDCVFFKILYKINPTMTRFLWKGKQYDSLSELGTVFLEKLWTNDPSMNGFIDELLEKRILSQYVLLLDDTAIMGLDAIKALESSHVLSKMDSRKKTMNYYLLAYMLSGKTQLYKDNTVFNSIYDLINYLKKAFEHSYEEFEGICKDLIDNDDVLEVQFESWLYALGKKDDIEQWKKSLLR